MKIILVGLLFYSSFSFSQKIALLNTDFKSPIIYTDSVTVQQTVSGMFPVGVNDFDTLYGNLLYIKEMLSKVQRSKMKAFELHAGTVTIKINSVPYSNGDRYFIQAVSKQNELVSKYIISDSGHSNKKTAEKVNTMMTYLKTNQSLFKVPNAVSPKIYNVIVITN